VTIDSHRSRRWIQPLYPPEVCILAGFLFIFTLLRSVQHIIARGSLGPGRIHSHSDFMWLRIKVVILKGPYAQTPLVQIGKHLQSCTLNTFWYWKKDINLMWCLKLFQHIFSSGVTSCIICVSLCHAHCVGHPDSFQPLFHVDFPGWGSVVRFQALSKSQKQH